MTDDKTARTVRLGLIGDNIARSKAPDLHRLAGGIAGRTVTYDRLVPRELGLGFDAVFDRCVAEGYRGINVTYPYKERAAKRVTTPDPLVRAMGAVNTVVFAADGPKGYNTDFSGFVAGFREAFGEAARPGTACLIGAGGVGKAVAFGLIELGVEEIRLVERDLAKAEGLAAALRAARPDLDVPVGDDAEAAARGADGLINGTPIGMVGYEGTPLPREAMRGAAWAFDAVYTPVDTPFMRDAGAEGLRLMSGYELFFHQGVHAFEIFCGERPPEPALREALAKLPA